MPAISTYALHAALATTLILTLAVGVASNAHATGPRDRVLHFDFPEMRIGVASNAHGPTGTTVFYFPDGVVATADVRGGSPGTLNVPSVRLGYNVPFIDAVVFSGGSSYGLSAATGMANAIGRVEHKQGKDHIATVLGAIIYDVGVRRFSRVTPDDALGAAALAAAQPGVFPMGAQGAGSFAMQGGYFSHRGGAEGSALWPHSGQGGAFRQVGPTKIAVFTVVNALGAIVDRHGRLVRCSRNDPDAECPLAADLFKEGLDAVARRSSPKGGLTSNTTITLVVTNQKLSFADLQRLAIQVHTSMARAIQPFSTEGDGDVLYAVTTDQVDNPQLSSLNLGVIASELAWDAVLNSPPALPPQPAIVTHTPAPAVLSRNAGIYAFADGSTLHVQVRGRDLVATFTSGWVEKNIYFKPRHDYRLLPTTDGQFIVNAPAHDVIRFDRKNGRIVGLTLNPGPWSQFAERQ